MYNLIHNLQMITKIFSIITLYGCNINLKINAENNI